MAETLCRRFANGPVAFPEECWRWRRHVHSANVGNRPLSDVQQNYSGMMFSCQGAGDRKSLGRRQREIGRLKNALDIRHRSASFYGCKHSSMLLSKSQALLFMGQTWNRR